MADISTSTISEKAKFYPDYIFNATALGNSAAITSDAFKFGCDQSGTELWIKTDTDITNTAAITIELLQDSDPAGSFTTSKTIATIAIGDNPVAGTYLVKYVSTEDDLQFCKVKITTAEDLQLDTVTSNLRYISR